MTTDKCKSWNPEAGSHRTTLVPLHRWGAYLSSTLEHLLDANVPFATDVHISFSSPLAVEPTVSWLVN